MWKSALKIHFMDKGYLNITATGSVEKLKKIYYRPLFLGGVKVGLGFWSKSDHCFSENNVFVGCIPREIMHQHKYVDLWMKDLLDL